MLSIYDASQCIPCIEINFLFCDKSYDKGYKETWVFVVHFPSFDLSLKNFPYTRVRLGDARVSSHVKERSDRVDHW